MSPTVNSEGASSSRDAEMVLLTATPAGMVSHREALRPGDMAQPVDAKGDAKGIPASARESAPKYCTSS